MNRVLIVLLGLVLQATTSFAQNFSDAFTRGTDPGPTDPWIVSSGNWTVTGGVMKSGPTAPSSYSYAYITNSWSNMTASARFQFPVGAYGGGLGVRLNPLSGAQYAAWIYPENSPGGSNVLKLIKFSSWSVFGYLGSSFVPMQQVNLPGVGTNFHTLQVSVVTNRISVRFDGSELISMLDADAAPHPGGGVALGMWTDSSAYVMGIDDVAVSTASAAPVANPDSYTVTSGNTLVVAAPGVLGNDSGGAGPLRALLGTGPTRGTLTLSTNGGFSYTPNAGTLGGDSFTYRASDGISNSPLATVTLTVVANGSPVAAADSYAVRRNQTLAVGVPGVLANDSDPDGQSLRANLVATTPNGALTLVTNGSFSYSPRANFAGADSFTYRASDGQSNSATTTVSLQVYPGGTLAFDDFMRETVAPWVGVGGVWALRDNVLETGTNASMTYANAYLPGLWTNYAVQARVKLTAGAFGGGLGICADPTTGAHYATWIYPEGSPGGSNILKLVKFQSWNSFAYNGTPSGAMQTVNVPPVSTNWHTLKLAVAGNQIAVFYDGVRVVSTTDTEAVTYAGGSVCADLWTDAVGARMSLDDVTVDPNVADDLLVASEDTVLTLTAPGVLANDTAVAASNLVASLVSGPTNGTLTLSTNGSLTYTPATNFFGSDSFLYAAQDGAQVAGTGQVQITVLAVNDPPVLPTLPNLTVDELTELVVTNSATDLENPAGPFTFQLVSPPSGATIDVSGVIRWAISEAQGPAIYTIRTRVTDAGSPPASSTNTFVVTVNEINSPGDLPPQSDLTIVELTTLTVTNTWIDPDLPANPASYTLTVAPTGAQISSNGIISWSPGEALGGTQQTFTTVASDNGSPPYFGTNTFLVTVLDTNSAPILPVIGNLTTPPLRPLVITNTAVDSDIPADSVSYNLLNSPTGSSISPDGIINWTPGETANDTTNLFVTVASDNGSPALSATNSFTVIVNSRPVIQLESQQLASEGCSPTNGIVDSGETVAFNLVLRNTGTGSTTNLVLTVVETNGITPVSAPQTVGVLAAEGGTTTQTVVFAASGICGTNLTARLGFQDGAAELGTASFPISLGASQLVLTQNFDSVTAPALPAGWTTSATDAGTSWVTQSTTSDTSPNAAFTTDATSTGRSELLSPSTLLPLFGQATLSFRHSYSLESTTTTNAYDGGVLEIKVGTNDFVDILAAGATFIAGGYNRTLSTQYNNSLGGRQAWSGLSPGFTNSMVNLPATLAGQTIQLRWVCAADSGGPSGNGWRVDSIGLNATVCCFNAPPVLAGLANTTIDETGSLLVTNAIVSAGTPANPITYELVSPPTGASIDADGVISWTPDETSGPSNVVFTTIARNSGVPQLAATNSFVVTVNEVNQPPALTLPTQVTIDESTLWSVPASVSDPDLPANLITFTLLEAPPGASINPTNGLISWLPPETAGSTTNSLVVVASDDGIPSLSATNGFTVIVNELNSAPVLTVPAGQTIAEFASLSVSASATDPDIPSNLLTFALVNAPTGMTIDPVTGAIAWTPDESMGGTTNTILVAVSDDGTHPIAVTNSFNVIVTELNAAPVLTVPVDQTIDELATLSVLASATDAEVPTNKLTFALVNPLAGMTLDPATGAIAWTPDESMGGTTNLIQVVVTDDGAPPLSATNSFNVVVTELNTAPVLTVPPSQTVAELGSLSVSASATDSDIPTNSLTFALVNAPTGMTIDPLTGAMAWTPDESMAGTTNTIHVVVTDGGSPAISVTNTFTVVVTDQPNTAPILTLPADQVVNELAILAVSASAVDLDVPTNTLTFSLANPPTGMTIDPVTGAIAWIPGESTGGTTNTILVVVTDDGTPPIGVTNGFEVIVTELNAAPVLTVPVDQTIDELSTLSVSASAADADVPTNSLSFALINGPTGMTIDPVTGAIAWSPGESMGGTTNTVQVAVADDGIPAIGVTNSFNVVVNEINTAPLLTVPVDQTVDELATLSVSASATDADVPTNTLTFSLVNAPTGMTIDPVTGAIAWTPGESMGGTTNTVQVAVADDGIPAIGVTNSFNVVVNEINTAPLLTVPVDQTVDELATLSVSASATDADVPTNTLTFSLVNAPTGMTIDPVTGAIAWSPGESMGGTTNTIQVAVTDGGTPAIGVTNSFNVVVTEINTAPILTVPVNQIIYKLATLAVSASATDADLPANNLIFALANPPSGMTIDLATGAIAWTPGESMGGTTNPIHVIVTDDGTPMISVTNTFTVVVTDQLNTPPVLTVPEGQVIGELTTLAVSASAVDSDVPTNTLTFTLAAPPTGMTIDPVTGAIAWTPSESMGGTTNVIHVLVSDDGVPPISVSNIFNVVVTEVNSAPVLTVPASQTVDKLATLSVSAQATDSDVPTNTLTFSLTGPTGMTIDSGTGLITWTPTEAQGPSTNLVTVMVNDNGTPSYFVANTFKVVVTDKMNTAPVLTVPADQTIDELATLSLSASATDTDIPTNSLAFTLVNAPAGMTIDPVTGAIAWIPNESLGGTTNLIQVAVTDDGNPAISVTNSFNVVVNELNSAPLLSVPADQTINELATLSVSASATDTDIPTNSLTFTLVNAPAGMTIDPVTGAIAWTPTESMGGTTNLVQVVVTDDGTPGISVTNSFNVVVNELNASPVLTVPADQTIDELAALSVSASATDADVPTNILTFALANAPTGMTIDPLTGAIAWTPAESMGGTTNLVQVVVTDDGTHPISVTNSFTVLVRDVVTEPMRITSLEVSAGQARLTWSSSAGVIYRVQWKDGLGETTWSNMVPDITADGPITSATNDIGGVLQRFYRVVRP